MNKRTQVPVDIEKGLGRMQVGESNTSSPWILNQRRGAESLPKGRKSGGEEGEGKNKNGRAVYGAVLEGQIGEDEQSNLLIYLGLGVL